MLKDSKHIDFWVPFTSAHRNLVITHPPTLFLSKLNHLSGLRNEEGKDEDTWLQLVAMLDLIDLTLLFFFQGLVFI